MKNVRSGARRQPITFMRGRRLYQIARDYAGQDGFLGVCDGRVVARGVDRAEVARMLIAQPQRFRS